jgi:hypothetical protein
MSVLDATGIMNVAIYSPEGLVVNGSYSLAAYVEYLKLETAKGSAKAEELKALMLDAKMRAERAAEEALNPENASQKDQYEALAAEYEAKYAEYNAAYLEYEARFAENSAFMNASLSLYAFSLASQDYARAIVK